MNNYNYDVVEMYKNISSSFSTPVRVSEILEKENDIIELAEICKDIRNTYRSASFLIAKESEFLKSLGEISASSLRACVEGLNESLEDRPNDKEKIIVLALPLMDYLLKNYSK